MKKIIAIISVVICFITAITLFGCIGKPMTPYIGENGNWWIGEEDLGVSAQGPKGDQGEPGNAGEKGDAGANGEPGQNGIDGDTPYIGENGNWWIGEVDTGVLADIMVENKKATDGLYFDIRSENGEAGMIVVDYDGESENVIIPDCVGLVPVIGVDKGAFAGLSKIKSLTLSRNTVYLQEGAFDSCSNLSEINFNNCKITTIPTKAFQGTALKNVQLPQTVTKIDDYAFKNSKLENINYENIIYFGNNSFYGTNVRYFYLKENVQFFGETATGESFTYFEAESLPSDWSSNLTREYFLNCHVSGDYLYTVKENNAVIYQYLGNEEKINIPSVINEFSVSEIGKYFNSLPSTYINNNQNDPNKSRLLKEVTIPQGVKTIDYSFYSNGTLVFVPSSVELMNSQVASYYSNYFIFEASELPFAVPNEMRYILGTKKEDVYCLEEKEMYFKENLLSYEFLAYQGVNEEKITVPAKIGITPVELIRTKAIIANSKFNKLKDIVIESGVSKIQKEAIIGTLNSIWIPKSVGIINANGLTSSCSYYFVEADAKPDEWDTYWHSSTTTTKEYYNMPENSQAINDYLCFKENDEITLIKYLGSSSTIKIPRKLAGLTVTKIKEGFMSKNSGDSRKYTIYIPKEIITIEQKSFVGTSYNVEFCFYIEVEEIPSTWNSDWFFSSYYNNNTHYLTKYLGQTLNY